MAIPVIDTEVHLMHPESVKPDFAKGTDEPVRKAIHEHPEFPSVKKLMTLDALLESMKANNIINCHIMGMSWRRKEWLDDNNAYIEECVKNYPDKFTGFFILHVENLDLALREIEMLDTSIFAGIKLLPHWQGFRINDPSLQPVFDACRDKNLFVMVHTDHMTQSLDGDTPQRFLDFVIKNPGLKILAPHLGGLLCLYQVLPKFSMIFQNVHFITSVSATMHFVRFAAEVNPDNILFGSDFPFNHCHDQETQIRSLDSIGISNEIKAKILCKNAEKLFTYKFKYTVKKI